MSSDYNKPRITAASEIITAAASLIISDISLTVFEALAGQQEGHPACKKTEW